LETIMTKSLPKLPKMPKATKSNPCECGCGGFSQNRFVPGHDSTLKGMIVRVERGIWAPEAKDDIEAQLDGLAEAMSIGQAEATARAIGAEWTPKAKRTAKAS
jgi:hypothetical protein